MVFVVNPLAVGGALRCPAWCTFSKNYQKSYCGPSAALVTSIDREKSED